MRGLESQDTMVKIGLLAYNGSISGWCSHVTMVSNASMMRLGVLLLPCNLIPMSPGYPYPAARTGNKDLWDKAFYHDMHRTLYPRGPSCPFLPLDKGNEDSGNEIACMVHRRLNLQHFFSSCLDNYSWVSRELL